MDTMSNNKPKFVILDNDPNMCTVGCVFTGLTHNQGISPLMQKCPIACSENLPAQGTTGNLVLTNDRGCQEPAKKTTVRRKREIWPTDESKIYTFEHMSRSKYLFRLDDSSREWRNLPIEKHEKRRKTYQYNIHSSKVPNIITGSITQQQYTKWELLSRRRTGSYWMRADGGRHGAGKTRSFDAKRFFWTSITCTVNDFRMDSATKRSTISYAATTRNDFKSIRNNLKALTLLKSFHIYSTIVVKTYPISS